MATAKKTTTKKVTNTRRARAAQSKKPVSKKPQESAKAAATMPKLTRGQKLPKGPRVTRRPLPSVWQLLRNTEDVLEANWRLFGSIVLLYVVLYVLLMQGLRSAIDVGGIRDQYGDRLLGGVVAYIQLLGGSSTSSSAQVGQFFQVAILLILSLATVWALRRLQQSDEKITLQDTLYKGMQPLVPTIILAALTMLQLLPIVLGLSLFTSVVNAGIARGWLQELLWGSGSFALCLLSLYWITGSIIAFYIVTIPDMTPLTALRASTQLIVGRRWTVLRKIASLFLVLTLAFAAIMVPVILVVPSAAQWLIVPLTAVGLVVIHTYLYGLYRELLND